MGILPTATGNSTISVQPYYALGELRLASTVKLYSGDRGFMPHFALGGQLGSLIVDKVVSGDHSIGADVVYGVAGNIGASYRFDSLGVSLAYGMSITNILLRHKVELALEFTLPLI